MSGVNPPGMGSPSGEFQAPPDEAVREAVPEPSEEARVARASAEGEALATPGAPERILELFSAVQQQLVAQARSAGESGGAQALEDLQGQGNVVGVGLGVAEEPGAGGEPGGLGLNVYVVEPTPPDQVRAVLVSSLGVAAAAADEVPINVIVTGVIDAQPHRFRIRPAPGGVSVGHYRITAGTIGCLATGNSAPRNARRLILSNNHVLANSNGGAYGDSIIQPGAYDGGTSPADRIAILERFVPINFAGGVNFVDCATGWAWPDRVRPELIYLSGGQQRLFRISSRIVAPQVGMLVGKSGRTTQLTVGRIIDINATIRVNYGGGRVALFQNQITIRGLSGDFSAGGDSGSSIWTWDANRNPVGLLFAGGGGLTFANRMSQVVAALDIRLVT